MKKITFINNGAPYISAENLNQMQDNIEESINEIIETGSNENGYYEKYSNGVLKCYHVLILDKQDPTYHFQYGTWTYPVSFIESPYINATPYNWTTHANSTKVSAGPTSCNVMQHSINVLSMTPEDGVNEAVSLVATGKWK